MSAFKRAPNLERLTDGRFGRLLEDANREFVGELDQPAAFQRLSQRLSESREPWRQRGHWLVPSLLLALAIFVAVPVLLQRTRSEPGPAVVAEDLRDFRKPASATSTLAAGSPAHPIATSASAEHSTTRRTDNKSAKPSAPALAASDSHLAPPGVPETSEPPPAMAPAPDIGAVPSAALTAAPSETSSAPDCLSLARGGQTRQAEACFLKRAEGSGLGAEMALYEVARLRRDVLADAAGALVALAEYRSRFPTGSLRREADMSQLELLLQLGRTDEALKQSDQLLSSSAGERTAELRLLRGNILRKTQSRFAEALHEYELAESAGMRGGDLKYFRALCLEAVGREPEAAALFAQYLEQPQHSYAEDARRRLQRLRP